MDMPADEDASKLTWQLIGTSANGDASTWRRQQMGTPANGHAGNEDASK
jgi:hypothetical protein